MERCLENGMRRKKKKNSFREDNNPADKDSDEDSEAEVSNSNRRRHSVMSSLANSSTSPGSTSPAASETAANENHSQKDAEQMYETADRFIELQLTSQLSSVNIASDPQEPATQKLNLSSSTKSSKSLRRGRFSADLLALNSFEQKEIDDLAAAYDTAFGNEKTAKVIHKPKTVQELMYNPDVYIRRTITFCQHFAGYNALSDSEKMLILKPFIFEATTVKFAFSFHPDAKSVSVFSDNSGEEVYEVDLYFGKELISDHTAPEENMRCGFAIRRSMCGDENLRNLVRNHVYIFLTVFYKVFCFLVHRSDALSAS